MAPARLPQKAGERGKTDRRAAAPLGRRLRSGARTPGSVPAGEDEAMREVVRARADSRKDRQAAKARRKAFLLRHALRSAGRAKWGPGYWRWRAGVTRRRV